MLTYVCLALSFYIMISFSFINSTCTVLKQNKLALIFSQTILYPFPLYLLATLHISSNRNLDRRLVSQIHRQRTIQLFLFLVESPPVPTMSDIATAPYQLKCLSSWFSVLFFPSQQSLQSFSFIYPLQNL